MSTLHRKPMLIAGLATLMFAAGAHAQPDDLAAGPGALAKSMRDAQAGVFADNAVADGARWNAAGKHAADGKPVTASDKAVQATAAPGEVRAGLPTGRYFVKLRQPSLVQQLARERAVRGERQPLALQSTLAVAREAAIRQEQSAALSSFRRVLGRNVTPALTYSKALNGFSLALSEREAALLARDPAVASVRPVLDHHLDTDAGPALIGAPAIWDGSATGVASLGAGVTVGIIDSGINSNHPSFAATSGSYTHANPLGAGTYLGWCATPANAGFCNDKLIGAYDFVFALVNGQGNVSEEASPEDNNGHGSHTAGTTAGNRLTVTHSNFSNIVISGVAPRANIVAYDACYTEISTGRGLCPSDATAASVEQAIDDGVVNVINYSIGGGVDPYNDMVSEAFLAATEMDIYVAASAGNSGPAAATLGHQEPWVATTAASTHGRRFGGTLSATGPGTPPPATVGIRYLGGSGAVASAPISAPLLDAEDVDAGNPRSCTAYTGTPFANRVALVRYDSCTAAVKVANLQAAGAVAVIVYYHLGSQVPVLTGLNVPALTIPAVSINLAPGTALSQFIDVQPTATVTLGPAGSVIYSAVDSMASFSSRGPNSRIDVLKPDLAAPGVDVLAATADGTGTGVAGTEVRLISGTSMASPHHAGAVALLRALKPAWTPMQIKSALMLTAKSAGMLKENNTTPATPFDYGNGRIQVAAAANAGLIMDENIAAFEAADPAQFGDPRTLNLASLYSSRCLGTVGCSFERRFTNPGNTTVTWNITVQQPTDVVVTANPSSITVAPGATAAVTFAADTTALAPASGFRFGEVILTDAAAVLAPLHMSVALRSVPYVLPERWSVTSARDAGGRVFEALAVPTVSDLTFKPSGLVRGTQVTQPLQQDPDGAPFFNLSTIWFTLIEPTQDAVRFVAQITASTAPDMDLYIGRDTNNDGLPQQGEVLASALTSSALEYVEAFNLSAASDYWVLVQNYTGSGGQDQFTLDYAWVERTDAGNLSVDAPAALATGVPFAATVTFDEPAMEAGDIWYGAFEMGPDAQGAAAATFGRFAVDVKRTADDVVKSADRITAESGEVVTYTVAVAPNTTAQDLQYTIADTLPTGMTLLPGSAQATAGTVSEAGNTVNWTVPLASGGFNADVAGPVEGASAALTYQAVVDAFAGAPRTLTNIAQHTTNAVGAREETTTASVTATGLEPADLAVTITDAPDPVLAGGTPIVYSVGVTNTSASPTLGVTASVSLPAGLSYASASGSGWTCVAGATVECSLAGSLAGGATAPLQLTVNVAANVQGVVSTSVTVASAAVDPQPGNNTATAITTVNALVRVFADGFEN